MLPWQLTDLNVILSSDLIFFKDNYNLITKNDKYYRKNIRNVALKTNNFFFY